MRGKGTGAPPSTGYRKRLPPEPPITNRPSGVASPTVPPLRDFALVAIAQHATRTLSRILGVDSRVPTDEELDALVAYQLSLGRQEDFNLPTLQLKSTLASNGKALYLDSGNLFEPGHKNCNGCHFNGGGTAEMSFNDQTPGFPDIDGSPRGFNIGAGTNANEITAGADAEPAA